MYAVAIKKFTNRTFKTGTFNHSDTHPFFYVIAAGKTYNRLQEKGCRRPNAVHTTVHMAILTSKRESPPGTPAYIFSGSQVDLNQVSRKIQYIWQQTVSLFEFGMVSGGSRLLIKVNRNLFNITCKIIIIHNI